MSALPPSPLAAARRFHLSPDGSAPRPDVLPAALHPFRDASKVRFTWPLVVTDDPAHPAFTPLAEALSTAAPDAPVLRDNLSRVERLVRANGVGRSLRETLTAIRAAVQKELDLHEDPAAQLDAAWATMVERLPTDAVVLGYGDDSLTGLIRWVLQRHHHSRRKALNEQLAALAAELQVLLPRTSADELEREVGHSAQFLDPTALASLVSTTRGAPGPERRQRVQALLDVLTRPVQLPILAIENTLEDAVSRFDALSGDLCRLIATMHAARLELEGTYDPDRHDAVLEALDWRGLSEEELGLLPTVVAIVPAETAARLTEQLSITLLSGRPLHIVAELDPASDPAGTAGWRLELAYLGVALRQAWVQQSCVSRPQHFSEGLLQALRSTRAALHVVGKPPVDAAVAPWLTAGAAIEGRALPLFRYDPSASAFADRVDFAGNPSEALDWPTDGAGAAFTFAHYALLNHDLRTHFHELPVDIEDDDLVPLQTWLGLAPDDAARKLPVIDGIDGSGDAAVLVLSRWLAYATRDRLSFWRSLQELGGVHNAWAERAAEAAREQARADAEAEVAALRAQHAEELETVRATAAQDAMRRLTGVLLGGDLLTAPAPAATPAATTETEAPAPAATPEAPAPEAEEEESFDDPYIDTLLCTSCNECINLNPKLFVYDNNKQASIGDPDGGSYDQLVSAATVCPARCIHPGKPRNPSEPNLPELLAKVAELGV